MGSFRHPGCDGLYALSEGAGPLRLPGWYDFARADQRGWDLLDIMDVTALYALSRGGWDLLDLLGGMTLYALTRGGVFF